MLCSRALGAVAAVPGARQFLGSGCGQQYSLVLWFLPFNLTPWQPEAELLHAQLGQQFILETDCSAWLVRAGSGWLLALGNWWWVQLSLPSVAAGLRAHWAQSCSTPSLHSWLRRGFSQAWAEQIVYVVRATGSCLCFLLL